MMRKLNLALHIAGALLLAVPGPSLAQSSGTARLRAGAAKVDITPHPGQLTVSTDSIRDHLLHPTTTCKERRNEEEEP